jgi:hypothetical protein
VKAQCSHRLSSSLQCRASNNNVKMIGEMHLKSQSQWSKCCAAEVFLHWTCFMPPVQTMYVEYFWTGQMATRFSSVLNTIDVSRTCSACKMRMSRVEISTGTFIFLCTLLHASPRTPTTRLQPERNRPSAQLIVAKWIGNKSFGACVEPDSGGSFISTAIDRGDA